MDELIGAILGLLGVILVIYLACLAIAFIIAVVAVLTPPVLSGFWLRNRIKKFRLSRQKVWQCVFLGFVLFALPLLALIADASVWPVAVWTSCLLGLAGPATYLTIEAYRQIVWPYRQTALAEGAAVQRLNWAMMFHRHKLKRLERALAREDQRNGRLRHQREQLLSLTHEMAVLTDPAFYGAELSRWSQKNATLPAEELAIGTLNTTAESVIKNLKQALEHPNDLVQGNPQQITELFKAAMINVEAITRTMSTPVEAYESQRQEAETLRAQLEALQNQSVSAKDSMTKATQTIRSLRKETVFVK